LCYAGLIDASALLCSVCACLNAFACCSARNVFDDIVAKTAPAEIVFEDDATLAFRDSNPVAPVQCVDLFFVQLSIHAFGWLIFFSQFRLGCPCRTPVERSVLVVPKRRISALSTSTSKDTDMLGRLLNCAR
jgi:hypothetical protein